MIADSFMFLFLFLKIRRPLAISFNKSKKKTNLIGVSKRRGKVKDESAKSKNSKNGEKVSSEILNICSNEVSVCSNVGDGHVRSLEHHLGSLGACLEGIAGDYLRESEGKIDKAELENWISMFN